MLPLSSISPSFATEMENRFSQKKFEQAIQQALRAELNVASIAQHAARLLLADTTSRAQRSQKRSPRTVTRDHVLARLKKRKSKTPGFYNLETHRVHGDSPGMRTKYPDLVFRRYRDLRMCGALDTIHSYEKEFGVPTLVSEEDLFTSAIAQVQKLLME